jgi:pyridoxal 5'-phosphate synthase pdxT subunit
VSKTIGVLSIQGAVSEHLESLRRLFSNPRCKGRAIPLRLKEQVADLDGVILPGGESTTISRILEQSGIGPKLRERILNDDLAVMGTCAGCVLLAQTLADPTEVTLLNAMEMEVRRNAFGRQKESFERHVAIEGLEAPFPGVFIRAPLILRTWGKCEELARIDEGIVMARQGRFLAVAFHPELTNDLRIHTLFYSLVE